MDQRFHLRSTTESDWQRLRLFRLENAKEHPVSYGAPLETVLTFDEEAWRMRARRGDQPDAASLVVIETATDRWVGMMACQIGDEDGPEPVLTGVYVSEDFRGREHGIADTLLEMILEWATPRSSSLRLWVYEGSEPARRFYARHGFATTGRKRPLEVDPPGGQVIEMTRELRAG